MKKFLSFTIIAFMLISFTTISYADVVKNETIYVNLKHDGSTNNIKVVNHISGNTKDEYFIDYGKYTDFQILVNGVEPIIEGNAIKWPTNILKEKDIYYEGTIDKSLPIKLNIKYLLDGKEINGEDLGGKSGKLKIVVSVKDSKDLTTQIQIPLNLNLFSNISAPSGVSSVVGKTMTVVFNHLPIGDQEFFIEADGKNIELDSILIASTASSIDLPDNISGSMDQLTKGIDDMSEATVKLKDGSVELNKGTNSLIDGLKSLRNGVNKLFAGTKEINDNSKILTKGFLDFNLGLLELKENIPGLVNGVNDLNNGLTTLNKEGKNIKLGLGSLSKGTAELKQGLEGLSGGLTQLNTGHNQLVELAKSLATSTDPRVKALAEGVIGEGIAINTLAQGAKGSAAGATTLAESVDQLYTGYEQFIGGLDNATKGFSQMNEGIKTLPQEIETMVAGHTQLTNGLTPLFDGISGINNGLSTLSKETGSLPDEVQKLADGQKEISDGLSKLNEEGFSKIKSSIDDFSDFDNSDTKEEYTSFVDNDKNKNSTAQFVMKTPSIKKIDISKDIDGTTTPIVKKSIFQRFLDLFKK